MDTAVKFVVLAALILTIGFAVVREGMNYLEHPSLQIIRYPADGLELILYHKGVANRLATLFVQRLDKRSTPQRITVLNYDDANSPATGAWAIPPLGTLRWTADGSSIYATRRETRTNLDQNPIWIYDLGSSELFEPGTKHWGTIIGTGHLDKLLELRGGPGHVVSQWYDLGQKENYVFSWKAHHWDRLAKPPVMKATSAAPVAPTQPPAAAAGFPAGYSEPVPAQP